MSEQSTTNPIDKTTAPTTSRASATAGPEGIAYKAKIAVLDKADLWGLAEYYLCEAYERREWCLLLGESAYKNGVPHLGWRRDCIVEVLNDSNWDQHEN